VGEGVNVGVALKDLDEVCVGEIDADDVFERLIVVVGLASGKGVGHSQGHSESHGSQQSGHSSGARCLGPSYSV
jgi:hypothetical protein